MKRSISCTFALLLVLLCLLPSCGKTGTGTSGTASSSPKDDQAEGPVVPEDADFIVAYAKDPDADIKENIKKIEAEHGITVAVLDYSELNTRFNPFAGAERLALDLATGRVKPDVIIAAKGTNKVAETVMEKGLYRDLTPYLEKDPHINLDNVFGTVLESFMTSDGKIWGISDVMAAQTLLGNDALLGDLAGKSGWTVGEMLDFAESLPDGVMLMDVSQEMGQLMLLGENGYLSFVDLAAGTCSFDSPEFLRWLKFLGALPTQSEYVKTSPLAQVEPEEKYEFYHNNKIALQGVAYFNLQSLVRDPVWFGTNDFTRIGYAGAEGTIFDLAFSDTFMIGKDAAAPDLAWEFIAACMEPDRFPDGRPTGGGTIPVLKDVYGELCEEYYDYYIIGSFSGGGGMAKKDPEVPPPTSETLDKPGYVFEFTEEDAVRLKKDLDSRHVTRIAERLPSEVREIVEEEISAFLGGKSTAETCASAIQSRVSIWLAEHK
ncbi:MAG: extracellular solute-binding protein [Clostridia bacterium]|nr:extracellular solute-binding protein [Clostridia bacterium]MBR5366859.1 extracellular solute-binding protein [Clostridia bacterium]